MDRIRERSANYARSLLGGSDEVPIDDLSDLGMMCVVDIPRLLALVRTSSNVQVERQPPTETQTEGTHP
jgi:hypothetical protein